MFNYRVCVRVGVFAAVCSSQWAHCAGAERGFEHDSGQSRGPQVLQEHLQDSQQRYGRCGCKWGGGCWDDLTRLVSFKPGL